MMGGKGHAVGVRNITPLQILDGEPEEENHCEIQM
jgi:hypothetical protein